MWKKRDTVVCICTLVCILLFAFQPPFKYHIMDNISQTFMFESQLCVKFGVARSLGHMCLCATEFDATQLLFFEVCFNELQLSY